MKAAWEACKKAVFLGKSLDSETFPISAESLAVGKRVTERCRSALEATEEAHGNHAVSDEELARLTRFTDSFPLQNYELMFGLVPELVNVVTVQSPPRLPASRVHGCKLG